MTDDPSLERIEKAIAGLGQEYRSPAGWEDRVRAAIRRSRQRRRIALGAVVAAAAAVLVWWAASGRPSDSPRLAFEHHLARRDVRVRGGEAAHVRDTLNATIRGGRYRALWLYSGERLVVRCPAEKERGDDRGGRGCARSDRVLSVAWLLEWPGSYILVGLRADAPFPEPQGDYDEDLAAAKGAGAEIHRYVFPVE